MDTYNYRQDMMLGNLFILFIFCNATYNFNVGVDGCLLLLADIGEALCSLLLAILDA